MPFRVSGSRVRVTRQDTLILSISSCSNQFVGVCTSADKFDPEDCERGRVGAHDCDFNFDGGDNDEFVERVCKISTFLKFGEDDNADAGDDYDDPSEGGNGDELEAFTKGGLDSPKGLDREDDDEDVGEDAL